MQYAAHYESRLGNILLVADEEGLTGLWFEGGRYCPQGLSVTSGEGGSYTLREAQRWLDIYFSGREPDFLPKLHLLGSEFQLQVWELLLNIPYGKLTTYGTIAEELARCRGIERMSAQAVGGAVGHNKISIIIPCHRVSGSSGSLTGYGGGIEKKAALLRLERTDMSGLVISARGKKALKS